MAPWPTLGVASFFGCSPPLIMENNVVIPSANKYGNGKCLVQFDMFDDFSI